MQAIAKAAEKFEMSPDAVAKVAVDGMLDGKAEIIPGFSNKISAWGDSLLPKFLVDAIASKLYKK